MIRLIKDFPKQILIRDNIWSIKFVRSIKDQPKDTVGECDPGEHVIRIKLGQSREERFKTLIHELAHAICFEYEIKENHSTIHAIEEPILKLLIDNGIIL